VRRILIGALVAAVVAVLTAPTSAGAASAQSATREFLVLYKAGVSPAVARAAIKAAGGSVVRENTAVGLATVRTSAADFKQAAAGQGAIAGVASNRAIGVSPKSSAAKVKRDAVEAETRGASGSAVKAKAAAPAAEPLAGLQWDMAQINATTGGSYKVEPGDRRVRVGIMDTGVDGSHPDIAPNFSNELSRNFTVDIPTDANGANIDGPCASEPDQSCNDPANVDENGHGTHVASIIGSPINGLGVAGVAPKVTLVNIRAGQDSGYFFLQSTVDALTYAADAGLDVVNMSFYTDPWLFNCRTNPADSPADQAEQRTVIEATQRALRYAWSHRVTLIAAAGNQGIDYTKPSVDASSPDFASTPGEAPYSRNIDPADCISLPAQGQHVIATSATGISTRKAYYSSFGHRYVDVSAPGGDVYDTADNNRDVTKAVLAAAPEAVLRAAGVIGPDGAPTTDAVVRDCQGGVCAYYQYLQGTSMASPHAVGVAALIVSHFGSGRGAGFGLSPLVTESVLRLTATRHACPTPRDFTYTRHLPTGQTVTATHTCEGPTLNNGFYGNGIVNALRAVKPLS
jgi:subtilisin family serine protease